MDFWKFFHRILLLACVGLVVAIVARLYWPLMERQRVLRAREAELRLNIQREAETLRMLKYKQEKLQEDPRFIEKIAREKLGYAKPGETIFRFVEDDDP
ncbi:MAG: septum formation initiator family protein [Lentisphaerae bacterium]|jgi:cell division protein FtsB|nr:septum formation initiator family protein [Lentisphaerota bacterium]